MFRYKYLPRVSLLVEREGERERGSLCELKSLSLLGTSARRRLTTLSAIFNVIKPTATKCSKEKIYTLALHDPLALVK
jgi:hypothetical protein